MNLRLPIALAVIGLASTGVLSTTFTAKAQQTSPQTEITTPDTEAAPKTESMTKMQNSAPGDSGSSTVSEQDHAAFLDARIAALHAGLTLTPDQEKLWPPAEQALRDFSKLMRAEYQKLREEKRPLNPIMRLKRRSANMIARGEGLNKIADAADPLYATLTEAQQHRLLILLSATFHPFGHGRAMMGRWGHGMAGPHMMEQCRRAMMGQGMMGKGMMGKGMMGKGMMGSPAMSDHKDQNKN